MPTGFKLIKAILFIFILLKIFDLSISKFWSYENLTILLFLILASIIIFAINKKYKFGGYVIYAATLFSVISVIIDIVRFLTSNMLENSTINIPSNGLSRAIYFFLLMSLIDIIINIAIFYYTYKHKDYFIN